MLFGVLRLSHISLMYANMVASLSQPLISSRNCVATAGARNSDQKTNPKFGYVFVGSIYKKFRAEQHQYEKPSRRGKRLSINEQNLNVSAKSGLLWILHGCFEFSKPYYLIWKHKRQSAPAVWSAAGAAATESPTQNIPLPWYRPPLSLPRRTLFLFYKIQ